MDGAIANVAKCTHAVVWPEGHVKDFELLEDRVVSDAAGPEMLAAREAAAWPDDE